ncbi:MAG: YidB family protein [Methylocystis sp.]
MSWLKAIIGGVIGAEALNLVKEYVEKQGGLEAVVKDFQSSGFGRHVDSWVSTGKNEAISAIEVGQAIGVSKLRDLAQATGVDFDKARDLLAEYLPIAIDKATPEGKLPPGEEPVKRSFY